MARFRLAKHYKFPIFAPDPATILRNGFLMDRALNLDALQWKQAEDDLRDLEPRRQTMSKFLKLIRNSEGATAIEYGLIAALIAVAAIGAMTSVGKALNTTFTNVAKAL